MPRVLLHHLAADESGAAVIEYVLIVVLIAMALVVALGAAGTSLDAVFDSIAGALPFAGS